MIVSSLRLPSSSGLCPLSCSRHISGLEASSFLSIRFGSSTSLLESRYAPGDTSLRDASTTKLSQFPISHGSSPFDSIPTYPKYLELDQPPNVLRDFAAVGYRTGISPEIALLPRSRNLISRYDPISEGLTQSERRRSSLEEMRNV
ncbi:hypothetical protein Scep_026060 [Stephania cephalantha]|uniref:Uncharacterized protein n=1 Tax=Stephania cephalantha TaxID=152367 RepID=A0AAP0HS49_9MAGN